jgi:redox-sensitive bicupin YhaK (pirin superfamily)
MATTCKIDRIFQGSVTRDGAGVTLNRIFGFYETGLLDPFLLLDYFGSDDPADFIAGFPWHPHRGIETVTYMLEGSVEHGDSMGNSGVISTGDVQWMTAGSGIIHQEMPKSEGGGMHGFQLWVNLPASNKMMKPRYQEIRKNEIPEEILPGGIKIKVIAGEFNGSAGPVKEIVADPTYFDVFVPKGSGMIIPVKYGYTSFACVFSGEGCFDEECRNPVQSFQLVKLVEGDQVRVTTKGSDLRFIFVSGKPLNEPIAWRGPVVMNTDEELDTAFREYRNGTFIK